MPPLPPLRPLLLAGLALAVTGCGTTNPCRLDNAEYVEARERPRLQMPEGVPGSERLSSSVLVIPAVAPNPDKLDPAPRCLDDPPPYFRRLSAPPAPKDGPPAKPAQ